MVVKNNIFSRVNLLNGQKCEVLELRTGHIFTANYHVINQKDTTLDFMFFMLRQLLLIDSKPITDEQLLNLSIDDYLIISEVLECLTKKLPGLK